MDFKKKLKVRLYLGIGYILSGLIIIAVSYIIDAKNSYFSSFGLALAVVGIVRIRSYLIITKNEERIKKQQIAETDERNIAIRSKAMSISFYIYILVACIAVLVLEIINEEKLAAIFSFTVCFLLIIYWISYLIIKKKS